MHLFPKSSWGPLEPKGLSTSGLAFCLYKMVSLILQMWKLRQAAEYGPELCKSDYRTVLCSLLSRHLILFFPIQLSRKLGQKKQRLLEAEWHQSPSDGAQTPSPKEPRLGLPKTLGPQRSIYFSSPKDHTVRLGLDFFDQPAVPLARAFLGQVM